MDSNTKSLFISDVKRGVSITTFRVGCLNQICSMIVFFYTMHSFLNIYFSNLISQREFFLSDLSLSWMVSYVIHCIVKAVSLTK